MIILTCKTATGEFDKKFEFAKDARKFYLKCKHSKKIKVVVIMAYDDSTVDYIRRGY